MPIVNGYTALATLKTRLGIGISDTTDDATLEAIVTAVSREIDDFCQRRFYVVAETRYFTARRSDQLLVDDLVSITTLSTDADGDRTYEDVWAAADFDLYPYNAQLESQPEPYWRVDVTPEGAYRFPVGVEKGVKILGAYGFSSTTPPVVEQACLFQSALEFRATDAPSGVGGSGEFQQVVKSVGLHPFVRRMLGPYRRLVI